MKSKLIYVSGPLTTGNMTDNIRAAVTAGARLIAAGYAVIIPHEKALLTEILLPMSYEEWLAYDLRCIDHCDAVVRLPGESKGADIETKHAKGLGIPVLHLDDLIRWPRWKWTEVANVD